MTEATNWAQELKRKRMAFGVSQNKLAVLSGISRPYLSDIETGKMCPTTHVKEQLVESLDRLNPDNPLELLVDYVRVRFPTTDSDFIAQTVLRIQKDYMLHEDYAFYSYQEQYRFGDIVIMLSQDIEKGVLIELKGKGCRQFERFLLAQQRSWYDFFRDCLKAKGIFKRLDLAINDKAGILDVSELARKCKKEECVSVFRTFKNYRSGELIKREEKAAMGNTLYIGSLKSEVYFCIYEKDYEQYVKEAIPLEEAEVKNRFEIRLKNERAVLAVSDLLSHKKVEQTVFGIINRYVRFVDKDESKRRSDWQLNARWAWFIGKERDELRLTTQPEPYTFERTLQWLRHQVAPTLKLVSLLDSVKDTSIVQTMIQEASLTDRQEKLLEQLIMEPEDVTI